MTLALTQLGDIWGQLFPAEQSRIVTLLIEKVIVSATTMEIRLRRSGLESFLLELPAKTANKPTMVAV